MNEGDALSALFRDHEVDDVVQDVFLAAASRLSTVRDADAIRGWLATITVRVAARRLRRRMLFRLFFRDEKPDEWASIGPMGEHHVLIRRIYQLLDGMPATLRIAWSLRYMQGEQLDEVARMCGCSLATAKRRIAAAHQQVAEIIGDE